MLLSSLKVVNLTYIGRELLRSSNLTLGSEPCHSQRLLLEVHIDDALLENSLAIYIIASVF